MLALDTETLGTDFYHGARPFFVTSCDEHGVQQWWEWNVNPVTRQPEIPEQDLAEIGDLVFGPVGDDGPELVLQNCKFDVTALTMVMEPFSWPWSRTQDCLIAGHLLASNKAHDLTSMVLQYLNVDIEPYELKLGEAVKECRRVAAKEYPDWRIAKAGLEDMPSVKGTVWRNDYWLPRAVCMAGKYPKLHDDCGHEWSNDHWYCERCRGHRWWTVLREYSNADSFFTIKLWQVMEVELKRRKLYEIYLERMKLVPVIYGMERRGVTINSKRLDELYVDYEKVVGQCKADCIRLSGNQIEELPINGVSNALRHVVYDVLKLKSNKRTKKGNESMDKEVLGYWLATLNEKSAAYKFIKNLKDYRQRSTAMGYMDSYRRFWVDYYDGQDKRIDALFQKGVELYDDWHTLHPSLNTTGTDTLRLSSSNPNEQNISKKEGFNLRYCFGPAPGREWWALDYENIELRIPAYEAGEDAMIELFERPDDPPYYGSNHLLFFDILHPDMFKQHGANVKKVYASTWYQWTKNGDFALLYGAVAESGTADRAYHVLGAQAMIEQHLFKTKQLSQRQIAYANKYGYVETIPDKTVNPHHGYPLLCTRSEHGRVKETVPLSYHVQGTAMWCSCKAMVRCQEQLNEWNRGVSPDKGYYMVLQVHDEMVFDFPKGGKHNLPKVRKLKQLMEQSGDDINVLLKVAIAYHPQTWSKEVKL